MISHHIRQSTATSKDFVYFDGVNDYNDPEIQEQVLELIVRGEVPPLPR